MRRLHSSPWTVALLSLFFLLVAGVIWAQPVQAASWIDRIFNRTVGEATEDLNTAGDKTLVGTGSQGPMVDNTVGFTEVSIYQRITGPRVTETTTPAQKAMLNEKYGKGAIGDIASGISYLYTPPAGTAVFVADLMNDAHIVPRAQAQGLGFAALDPVLSTWKMFRNLAYLLYVIIFLVIGFMVMFKSQMGKTAVTLQSALPNIVVSLIFVTFSYAIAGFLIDIMYVLMYLLIGMFPTSGGSDIMDYNFLQLGLSIILGDGTNTGAFKSFAAAVDGFVAQSVNFVGEDRNNSVLGFISGITVSLIVAIAILVGVFKLFFELLKTYVTIVLMIAFSPLMLMLGAIPGQDVFQGWIRDLVGNLMAFPTTLLIIIVFRMFTQSTQSVADFGGEAGGFLPPFLIGRGSAGALTTLVGIGIVLIMPELIVQMKKAMGVKEGLFQTLAKDMVGNIGKNFKQGSVAGQGLAMGGASLGGATSGAYNYLRRGDGSRFELKGLGEAMSSGYKVGNVRFGGARPAAEKMGARIKPIRTFMDRAAEGRLFDPEDLTTMLSEALKNRKGTP
jgi:hypothetical protein